MKFQNGAGLLRGAATVTMLAALALPAAAWAEPAAQAQPLLRTVGGGGRLIVNAMEYPWSAIGRLNVAGRAFCSGFLIGDSTVLTAAHCLQDHTVRRWRSATELHFVAGYQLDQALIDSPVHHYVLADDYEMSKNADPLKAGADWAVLRLGKPIGREAGYLGLERMNSEILGELMGDGALFLQAGYRGDWPHVISVDSDCNVLGFIQGTHSLVHDCEAVQGDSGSPVLAYTAGQFRVVGLISMETRFKKGTTGAASRVTGVALATAALGDRKRRPEAVGALARTGDIWVDSAAPTLNSPAAAVPEKTIQLMLQSLGSKRADPTGKDRAAMADAIRTYQRTKGLPVTGRASIELLGHLMAASKAPAKSPKI